MGSVAVKFQFLMINYMVIIFIYLLDFQFNNNNGVDELKFGQFIFRFMIFFYYQNSVEIVKVVILDC